MKLKVVLEPQPEGGYVAYVPALPGCVSQGETVEEVLKNIREAIELYLEVALATCNHSSMPSSSSIFFERR